MMVSTFRRRLAFFVLLSSMENMLVLSEGPVLDGDGWPRRMEMVMHKGHLDMKSWQAEIESEERENEDRWLELETPPEINDTKPASARSKRFVMDKKKLRWPHAVIPYVFDISVGLQTRQHIEQDIFGLYEYWTHFRFVPWNASVPEMYQLGHDNYLIFVEYNSACWSYTGNNRVLKGQKISCCKYDRCIHELGHAIGFIHEISNPQRDDYIRINYQNILNGMAPNFEKITRESGVKYFGFYDMSSVMGYNTLAFSKNLRSTITVLDPEMEYMTSQRDVTAYYMFYEAQLLYDMKAEKCPEFSDECANGGYLSYVNGSCRCRCPEGLDHRSNCTKIEDGGCGSFITMSNTNTAVNITSPGYPDTAADVQQCVWFIKGPKGSKIVLDFVEFNIPYSKSCSTHLEIRFVMPGQPGIRYCGDSFSETVVSYGEYMAITFGGSNAENQGRFTATLRLITGDDMCYTNGGRDGSYQGKINYGRHFQTCLPWDKVTDCSFHTFNVTWMDLEENYCRNPGHGTQPWCYVNADNCARSYCDVCHLRKCYDLFDDCDRQLQENPFYCQTDQEGKRGCRRSCGMCNDSSQLGTVSTVTCTPPATTIQDGVLISNKTTYRVGEKAVYRCSSDTGDKSITCTSEGTWTHIAYICDACADQRLDCDILLERTPTMCAEYRNFAELKCARTCALCSLSNHVQQKVECNVNEMAPNVSESSTGPYHVGDVVEFTCRENYVHVEGDLRRACKSDQTLTGEIPKCTALEDTVSDLYHVDLRQRRHTSQPGKIYTFSNTYYRIRRKGEITAWTFYSLFTGKVTFHVWRQAGNTSSVKLLGSNDVEDTLENRLVTINVPEHQRISVQPGDFIGVYFPITNPGGITYDACKTKYDPQGGNQLSPVAGHPWHIGQYYTMKQTSSCKLFSISAKIGPKRTIDINLLRNVWKNFLKFHRY